MKALTSFKLQSLRVQVLLWTILPLTILLIVFSLGGVWSHQQSMRALAIAESTRFVHALAEIVALRYDNASLNEIPPDLSFDETRFIALNHPHALNTVLLLDDERNIVLSQGTAPTPDELQAWLADERITSQRAGVLLREGHHHEDIIAFVNIRNSNDLLIVRESWHLLTDPLMRFEQLTPFIFLIALTVSLLTLFFGLRSVVYPLQALGQRANDIGQGDFTSIHQPVGGVQEIEDMRLALEGMAQRVKDYQSALQNYVGAITQAQEDERARLARDLHDETTQTLIALGHKAQMVQRTFATKPEESQAHIAELRTMLAQAIEEIRRFSRALHPHYLEELGLVAGLQNLAQSVGATFTLGGQAQRLSREVELTCFRIAQEALNNAHRHAKADNIALTLHFEAERICLTVQDDGCGFEFPTEFNQLTRRGHFGLLSMRERAQIIGGDLQIQTAKGGHTTIRFCAGM